MGREIEKRKNQSVVGDSAQYTLALGVVGVMLYIIGLPGFVIFFLAAFSFFLWKLFASGAASDTRKIFEFYLAANEILRDDERRWYGFEVHDAIDRGERIIRAMPAAPPLLIFAVGALYLKSGDAASGEKYLASVVQDETVSEAAIVFPSNELRDYVRVLRKIEREPAEAPQTSAAVRSLERIRKNKGSTLLERCRSLMSESREHSELPDSGTREFVSFKETSVSRDIIAERKNGAENPSQSRVAPAEQPEDRRPDASQNETYAGRKPISELLQDIYDDKVQ